MRVRTNIYNIIYLITLLPALTACQDNEHDNTSDRPAQKAGLAFSISTSRTATRMSEATAQADGSFRGIDKQYLFPFSTAAITGVTSLPRIAAPLSRYSETVYHYFDNESVEIPLHTTHFLCYCTAKKDNDSPGIYGKTTITIPEGNEINTSGISFSPAACTNDYLSGIQLKGGDSNDASRFVYPAELLYYALSPITTSQYSQKDNYSKTWNDVLAGFGNESNGVMEDGVQSVAITNQLNYAVGCLQIGMVASSSLQDANGTTITISSGRFPLSAVFATGQYKQAFNFTPVVDSPDDPYANEYIVYDREITGFSMGGSTATTPASYTNTLVLQSREGKNIRFALEFTNNFGASFTTNNGEVTTGAKFYLVGTIRVPATPTYDYQRQVFTKDYYTRGIVEIKSLKNAYPYLPDLFNPRLEIDLELQTQWIQSSTTNVPL